MSPCSFKLNTTPTTRIQTQVSGLFDCNKIGEISKNGRFAEFNFELTSSSSNFLDSDGSPILTNAELGKLVRNSAKSRNDQANQLYRHSQNQQLAATRNLYNRQQPMQYAPTNRRQYGSSDGLSGYNPSSLGMGASSSRDSNANNDDDDAANFGPNFNEGENDGESNADSDGQPMNLNQAASGYPSQGDISEGAGNGAGFSFGGADGYGPSSSEGAEFGPSSGFGGDGRRAKSASTLMGSRNYGSDEDAGAPRYGPNSAINSGAGDDDEGRAGYAPDGQNDDNDDE